VSAREQNEKVPAVASADEETMLHPYLTQRQRERGRGLQRWRREMPGFWTHAEVAALGDDGLFAGLAERGFVATRADILDHIARMPAGGSAWRMSRIYWLPGLRRSLSAADRDFLGLAAIELWRRFRPDDPPVESVLALLADAEDRLKDDPPGYLAGLVRFLAAARERIDPARPKEVSGVRLFLEVERMSLVNYAIQLAVRYPELAAEALKEAVIWSELVHASETAPDRAYFGHMVALLHDALGHHEEAERRLRAVLARTPDDLTACKMLALQNLKHHFEDRARLAEALTLWDAIRPPADASDIVRFLQIRASIVAGLRSHEADPRDSP